MSFTQTPARLLLSKSGASVPGLIKRNFSKSSKEDGSQNDENTSKDMKQKFQHLI